MLHGRVGDDRAAGVEPHLRAAALNIRTRLLLLVFAVWVPAAVGFGLLALSTYEREAASGRERLQELAQSLNSLVERELDKRRLLAETLAASKAVHDLDIERFYQDAGAAAKGVGSWVFLADATSQLTNTLRPLDRSARLPRGWDAPLITAGEPQVLFTTDAPLAKGPALAVFAPEKGTAPARYNVGVAFFPSVVQAVLDGSTTPDGGVASVMDQRQRVMARSRDPAKWVGTQATGSIQARAQARESGFADTVTLDGVPSLTYLTPPNRYGWAVVVASPKAVLAKAARRVTYQAAGASFLLLLIGLLVALAVARRIVGPVRALRSAAMQLGSGGVPLPLATGLPEADEVGTVLHAAGLQAREATRTLEERVAQAVEETHQTQARLFDAQKREAIGRLTGGLAHDFNNLLQTINTGLQVIDRTTGEGPHRRVLQGALRASAKAADLVRQMLTFGRAQPLQPQPVDLDDFVLKNEELTRKAVGDRIRLSASIEPHLPAVFVDPIQLELAFLNLVFNARDAMPGGGNIFITGRTATADETSELAAGTYVAVEILDEGTGMSAETAAMAFEPYFTTKAVGSGSGLGLAQVMAFARESGGDARIDSRLGSGTRVSMFLPASDLDPTAPKGDAARARPSQPLRILMAEDDVLVASVVVPALEEEGHTVQLCGTADEARDVLARDPGRFDVVFSDVVMPGAMTGVDLAAWCREHVPDLRVVIATGYMAQPSDPDVRVLRKPYGIDAVLVALQEAARGATGDVSRA